MNMNIELPDELAPALKAKAQAQGISLERYVLRVLEEELGPATPEPATAKPLKTGYGMWAKYGPTPSAEEIDENRREMFRNFANDF